MGVEVAQACYQELGAGYDVEDEEVSKEGRKEGRSVLFYLFAFGETLIIYPSVCLWEDS